MPTADRLAAQLAPADAASLADLLAQLRRLRDHPGHPLSAHALATLNGCIEVLAATPPHTQSTD